MIDLREKDRLEICRLAEKVFPAGTEIWAYGSRVKGTSYAASDLDLAVHFPAKQDRLTCLSQRAEFVQELQDSNIPIIVQVMAWNSIPESFKENIQACYQVLWTAPSEDKSSGKNHLS